MTTRFVGVIDEAPFDPLTWSGSSRYFFQAFRDRGCLVEAFAAEPGRLVLYAMKARTFHRDLEAWKFAYHIDPALNHVRTRIARRKFREIDRHVDVVLQIGAWYDLTGLDRPAVSYHDGNLATLLASPFGHPPARRSFIRRALEYERTLYGKLDLVFPMSEWLARSFVRDFSVNEDKVIAVGAGINLPVVRDVGDRAMTPHLLMVGKQFVRKGGEYLLEAFNVAKREIPDLRLTIVGPTLDGLPEGVECVGFLDKRTPEGLERLFQCYQRAGAFVLPSLYEPFGIALAEAMAHKLPCIGTDNCAIPEIVKHEETGFLVPVADSESLARSIVRMFSDQRAYAQMSEAAYRHYADHFVWSRVVDRIVSAVEERL